MRASFETTRLSLSLAGEADRENLVALERDPEVMRFLNGGRPTPDDGAEEGAGFLTPRGGENDVWAAVKGLAHGEGAGFVGWFSRRGDWIVEGTHGTFAKLGKVLLNASGSRLGHRGREAVVGRRWIRGQGFRADCRHNHGGQPPVASRDGKDRIDPCPHRLSALARPTSRERTRGSRV